MLTEYPLGRRTPRDWAHVERHPLWFASSQVPTSVERRLDVNTAWRRLNNQGQEGACAGFAATMVMAILNRQWYSARWLYRAAQAIDEWDDTPPAEGTSVRAVMDVLRLQGHRRVKYADAHAEVVVGSYPVDQRHGILSNRWARSVDDVRTCIADGVPAVLGCNWYQAFDRPEVVRRWFGLRRAEYRIGTGNWGRVRGGHAVAIIGASDSRDAVLLCNSWGIEVYAGGGTVLLAGYPLVWLSYDGLERLIREDGECTVIVDKVDPPKEEQ